MGVKVGKRTIGPELHPAAMAALHDVAVAAGGVSDPDRLANLVVVRARQIAGGEGAVLRWYEPATNSFLLLATVGTGEDMEALIAANAPTAISGAFKTGHPVVLNDYKTSGKTTPWGRLHNITAQVAVPLRVDGRPVGTLAVLSYTDRTEGGRPPFDPVLMFKILVIQATNNLDGSKNLAKFEHF